MKRVAIAVSLVLASSCARKLSMENPLSRKRGPLVITANWIKDKGDKFDLGLELTNESRSAVAIRSEDVRCGRGSGQGKVVSSPFKKPGETITLGAGDQMAYTFVCEVKGSGDFIVLIGQVYRSDPRGRGGLGEVLTTRATLEVTQEGKLREGESSSTMTAEREPERRQEPERRVEPERRPEPEPERPKASLASNKTPAPPPAAEPAAEPKRTIRSITAGPDWVIAIMEVEDAGATDKKKAIDPSLVRDTGDQLRIFVAERGVRTIDKSAQERALKDQIQEMKSESYKACYDNACQVEVGKALAASHILRSKITRFGSKCVLNAELIELRTEVVIGAASSRGDCSAEGFLSMCEEASHLLSSR